MSIVDLSTVPLWDECEAVFDLAELQTSGGHACTREPDHPGDHVQCGLQFHEVKRWPRYAAERPAPEWNVPP